MMVRYAHVEQGAPFPDTPEDPPHITDLKQKRPSKMEDMEQDPILASLYRMRFGASQVSQLYLSICVSFPRLLLLVVA